MNDSSKTMWGEISCHLWRIHDDEKIARGGGIPGTRRFASFNEYLKLNKYLHIYNNSMVDNLSTMCFDQ